MSPTQRTLARLRKDGWMAAVVEKWNPHARIRQDLFGFIDIVAVKDGTLAIQATSIPNMRAREAKCLDEKLHDKVLRWKLAGNRFEVWGWALRGPRGKRKVYTLKRSVCIMPGAGTLEFL